MYVTAIRRVGGLWPRQPYHVFVLIHLVPDMHIVFKVQYEIKYRLHSNTITRRSTEVTLGNFEHLVSLSSEHRNTQTDRQSARQLKTLSGSLSKL